MRFRIIKHQMQGIFLPYLFLCSNISKSSYPPVFTFIHFLCSSSKLLYFLRGLLPYFFQFIMQFVFIFCFVMVSSLKKKKQSKLKKTTCSFLCIIPFELLIAQ